MERQREKKKSWEDDKEEKEEDERRLRKPDGRERRWRTMPHGFTQLRILSLR